MEQICELIDLIFDHSPSLILAVEHNNYLYAEYLLSIGVPVDGEALIKSITYNFIDLFALLAGHIKQLHFNILDHAIRKGRAEIVQIILNHTKYLPEDLSNCVVQATFHYNLTIIKILVEHGVIIPNTYPNTPFLSAISYNSYDIVEYFISLGIRNDRALLTAINHERTEIIRLLVQNGYDVDQEDVLATAVSISDEMFDLLIELGATVKDVLSTAVSYNRIKSATYLLEHGCSVSDKAIMRAYQYNNQKMIALLGYYKMKKLNLPDKSKS